MGEDNNNNLGTYSSRLHIYAVVVPSHLFANPRELEVFERQIVKGHADRPTDKKERIARTFRHRMPLSIQEKAGRAAGIKRRKLPGSRRNVIVFYVQSEDHRIFGRLLLLLSSH